MNQSRTSVSTRSEIGCFAVGSTTVASAQKSSGRSASSGGEVARISRSVTRRSRVRSARPRSATSRRVRDLFVRLAFTTVALPGRDDSTVHHASGLDAVRIDDCQRNILGQAQGDHAVLAVVASCVSTLQRRPIENLRGEFEIETALSEISSTLASIPGEAHSLVYDRIYTRASVVARQPVRVGQSTCGSRWCQRSSA